jgi:MFS family permease
MPSTTIGPGVSTEARTRPQVSTRQPATESCFSRPLLIFCVCVMLFHFANAPLLPLVGQKLALAHPKWADAMMSSCIVAAQLVMLPIAILVGRTADTWGRKPLFLIGFGILPVRAVLYTFSDDSAWLIGVQLLDGVGAGIFGALAPLVIADVMRGTGRYNLAQGLVPTVQGIGASISGFIAGEIVDHAGYHAAFLTLGAAAAVAVTVFWLAMPETADHSAGDPTSGRTSGFAEEEEAAVL